MRHTALILAAAALALAAPATADAAGLPWVHKAKCLVGLGRCVDPPPRPGPQTDCTASRVGDIEVIWDPRLGAYVEWICTENGWRRIRIVPQQGLPWDPPRYRRVIDFHRACKPIICKKVAVAHYYPSRWLFGRTP